MKLRLVPVALACALGVAALGADQGAPRTLNFEDRVAAQRAIEEIYWQHRIWPKENPFPKPGLSAVMSDDALRAKVEDYLKKSVSLAKVWQRAITTQQLQAEMDRMAATTADGRVLSELFAALGNDPFLIAETLVRQTIVNRMIRDAYTSNEKRSASFDTWWAEEVGKISVQEVAVPGPLRSASVSDSSCIDDTWKPTSIGTGAPDARYAHTVIWTGAELIVWGGYGTSGYQNSGGRYDPATDSWTQTSTGLDAPNARADHSALWTGTEMVVWGGTNGSNYTSTGARYNPSKDSWTPTSTAAGVPLGREAHSAVWTGSEMIVWGGYDGSDLNSGARYAPSSDTWMAIPNGSGVPSARRGHKAVWTGTEMIVWGGLSSTGTTTYFNTGGRYSPSTNTWTATSTGAHVPEARVSHSAVWTGTEMIIWGGNNYNTDVYFNTGARYNPSTDVWSATATGLGVPLARGFHAAIWTGAEMIIWGGVRYNFYPSAGGRYNPLTDTWAATSTGEAVPASRYLHPAAWTGSEMIIWGGHDGNAYLQTGGRYCATTCATPPPIYRDADGDSFGNLSVSARYCDGSIPAGYVANSTDCDDTAATIHPGALELCNGVDENCNGLADDGLLRTLYRDLDGDGYGDTGFTQYTCASPPGWAPEGGDCNESDSSIHPGATEACNGVDDNCTGQIDEDGSGTDSDGDGIHNICDNCRVAFNPDQLDADSDLVGNACDNCVTVANTGQQDLDSDQRGDVCDNCPAAYNPFQDDSDVDRRGDACDNCVFDFNPPQSDFDHDGQGDRCDLNDGLIYIFSTAPNYIEWQVETGPASWNVYEGSLAVLRLTGVYSQAPSSNPLAQRSCHVSQDYVEDFEAIPAGAVKFSLVTGVTGGGEGSLGTNSAGATRPNASPCP